MNLLLMHFLLYLCHQQLLLERFLNRAAEGFQNLFTAVEDHFELCLAKCRTSSQVSCGRKKSMKFKFLLQIVYPVKRYSAAASSSYQIASKVPQPLHD